MTFTEEEAFEGALDFFGGGDQAKMPASTFVKKYALRKGDDEFYETRPDEMWDRMATVAAEEENDHEKWYQKFYDILEGFKAVPQGSIMYALGNPYQKSSCSNCFVIPLHDDSLEGIFNTAKEMARTYSYRGGVGTDISVLRPRHAPVNNSARKTTGAVSFMDFYSYLTGLIGQQGRRGALMLTISDSHPDLYHPEDGMDFISIKRDLDKVNNANISVRVSDAFMEAVENGDVWELSWKREDDVVYVGNEKIATSPGPDMEITRTYPAREIWENIVESATESAEPGILFWDRIREEAPSDQYVEEGFKTISTNPCSEIPLGAYGACTLLSLNLSRFVRDPFTDDAEIKTGELYDVASIATRFLDNVKTIDARKVPLSKQAQAARQARRIGIGTHGLADLFIKMKTRYDSDKAVELSKKVYRQIRDAVYSESIKLAEEKGPFPAFNADKHLSSPFIQRLPEPIIKGIKKHGLRNIACLTIAPTGSVSILSQTSSGIEPIFRYKYKRRIRFGYTDDEDQTFEVFHPLVQKYLEEEGYGVEADSTTDEGLQTMLPNYFTDVTDINWTQRTELQGTIQKYIDHAISNTINIPKDTKNVKQVVHDSYMKAWKNGCKGYTVYVEGSRDEVPLETSEEDPKEVSDRLQFKADTRVWEIPDDFGHFFIAEGHDQVFIIGYDFSGRPLDYPLIQFSKSIEDTLRSSMNDQDRLDKYIWRAESDMIARIGRLVSLGLKTNNADRLMNDFHLYKDKCVLAEALYDIFEYRKIEEAETCPQCHSIELVHRDGCVECSECGWEKCSV